MTRKRILVVDDEPKWCRILAQIIEDMGHEVFQAGSFSVAKQSLSDLKFDLALVDIDLDGLGFAGAGGQLFYLLREQYPQTRVIAITATSVSQKHMRDLFVECRIRDFVNKDDFNVKKFRGLIHTVLAIFFQMWQELGIDRPDEIATTIQASFAKDRPRLFDTGGLCAGHPLEPSTDEYFVAHKVNSEKIADLRHALEEGVTDTQLRPYTPDQDIRPGHILCKIAAKIQTTAFCIFDLPESQDRNVYLELGIAIGLGRPFILIKSDKTQVPSLVEGLDHSAFSSYTGLRWEVGERVQVGQFSAILPQEDVAPTDTYFLADGEFEGENFREAIRSALQDYALGPVYLAEGQVGPQLALTQLIRNIQTAHFGVYRIDEDASANTFLALGIAIGLNKPWLLVAREGAAMPQDVRGLSNFNFRSFAQLETEFVERCGEFLRRYADEARPAMVIKTSRSPAERRPARDTMRAHQPQQNAEARPQGSIATRGIPSTLIVPLHRALLDCDEFHNTRQLREVFSTQELLPWRDRFPGGDNPNARVSGIVGYLVGQRHASKGNALVLLLRTLGEHYYPNPDDERHGRLLALADQLEWLGQRSPKPEATVLEANPEAAQMLWIADAEKMLACAKSVARVEVPRFRKGKQDGKSSGTGWLVAPDLALTCWHVVENLAGLETSLDPSDLQTQFDNTLLTFDYTVAGNGLQYGVAAIEHPNVGTQTLDYAVLRLVDRDDAPLRDRGYLRLDVDAPLNVQSSLYIIQHPLGQAQQGAGDTYVRPSPNTGRILYKTPTEPGTSGAPVFNRINWRVVALHNGENEAEQLREGILLRAILADLEQNRPDLYEEIMSAQKAEE